MMKLDPGMLRVLQQAVIFEGVPESSFYAFLDRAIQEVEGRHHGLSPNYLQFRVLQQVWEYFLYGQPLPWKDVDPKPRVPTKRERLSLRNSQYRSSHTSGNSLVKSERSTASKIMADPVKHEDNMTSNPHPANARSGSRRLSAFSTDRGSRSSESGANTQPAADAFVSLESYMERKARAIDRRHEFFVSLQERRDEANEKFPACTRAFRQWYAQSLVWEQWFSNEPFPGRKPVPYELSWSSIDISNALFCVDKAGPPKAANRTFHIRPDRLAGGSRSSSPAKYSDRGAFSAQRNREPKAAAKADFYWPHESDRRAGSNQAEAATGLSQPEDQSISFGLRRKSTVSEVDSWTQPRTRRVSDHNFGRLSYEDEVESQPTIRRNPIHQSEKTKLKSVVKQSELGSVAIKSRDITQSLAENQSNLRNKVRASMELEMQNSIQKEKPESSREGKLQQKPEALPKMSAIPTDIEPKMIAVPIDEMEEESTLMLGDCMASVSASDAMAVFDQFDLEYRLPELEDAFQCHFLWQDDHDALKLFAVPFRQYDRASRVKAEEFLAFWAVQFIKYGITMIRYLHEQGLGQAGDGSSIEPSHPMFPEIDALIAEESAKAMELSKKRKLEEAKETMEEEGHEEKRVKAV